MRHLPAFTLAACALGGAALPEDAPSLKASASKTDVTVGETFLLEVAASGPPGTTWTFPAEAGDEKVELRTPPSPQAGEPPAPGTHRYEAAVFALGEVSVPPVDVQYRLPDGTAGTASTPAIPLRVLSVLPKDPKEHKLADIRGPVGASVGRAFWLAAGAAGLLLSALGFALWRRRRRALAPMPAAPPTPPDAAALAALDRLAQGGMLARGEHRAFYIELAVIAKRYLEERLQAPVLEMTSAEAVAFLREHGVARDLAPTLRDVALAADRVKFARAEGVAEEAARHLAAVRGMVGTLEARLRPGPAQGSARVA